MDAVAADVEPVLGSITPRIYTRPLVTGPAGPCGCSPTCALTSETSYGFRVDRFARDVLGSPLDPWERWLVIHAGELLPDGRPRFRTVLAIVARQQGKSLLMRVLILYWLFVEKQPIVLATSTDRSYAKAAWRATCDVARDNPYLSANLPARPTVEQIGEEELRTVHGTKYRFAATNRRAGRSLTVNRLVLDEIREHQTWDAWGAATNAMNAVPDAQCIAVSNQGDDTSVVLDDLRNGALDFIATGDGDPRTGLFEYSAPEGSDPTDLRALACSNPNLGRRTDADTLLGAARRAVKAGGEQLASFLTEVMCIRIPKLNPAYDAAAWGECGTDTPVDLAAHRRRVALCLDVNLEGTHATLVAAALLDGVVRTEVVAAWDNGDADDAGRPLGLATLRLRNELPAIVARVKPGVIGWFPTGPAAAIAAELAERKGNRAWPPRYVKIAEIRGEMTAVCMGLAEIITARQVQHPRDPLQTDHVQGAERAPRGDGWVLTRQGAGAVDAAYATAGAVHLARTLAVPPRPKVVSRRPREGGGRLRPVE